MGDVLQFRRPGIPTPGPQPAPDGSSIEPSKAVTADARIGLRSNSSVREFIFKVVEDLQFNHRDEMFVAQAFVAIGRSIDEELHSAERPPSRARQLELFSGIVDVVARLRSGVMWTSAPAQLALNEVNPLFKRAHATVIAPAQRGSRR